MKAFISNTIESCPDVETIFFPKEIFSKLKLARNGVKYF